MLIYQRVIFPKLYDWFLWLGLPVTTSQLQQFIHYDWFFIPLQPIHTNYTPEWVNPLKSIGLIPIYTNWYQGFTRVMIYMFAVSFSETNNYNEMNMNHYISHESHSYYEHCLTCQNQWFHQSKKIWVMFHIIFTSFSQRFGLPSW